MPGLPISIYTVTVALVTQTASSYRLRPTDVTSSCGVNLPVAPHRDAGERRKPGVSRHGVRTATFVHYFLFPMGLGSSRFE